MNSGVTGEEGHTDGREPSIPQLHVLPPALLTPRPSRLTDGSGLDTDHPLLSRAEAPVLNTSDPEYRLQDPREPERQQRVFPVTTPPGSPGLQPEFIISPPALESTAS